MSDTTTRDRIIGAADQLFYERGFEHTSFSDIADAVGISRGNFYFHFKTKDEILHAVIDRRVANTRQMLEEWEKSGETPADRIRSFINILIANRSKIMLYGCPVGTLCAELAKLDHAAQADASKLFTLFREWLRRQFVLLGRAADADALAMHALARSQGISILANTFHDEAFIDQEVQQMCNWLRSLTEVAGQDARAERPIRRRTKGGGAKTPIRADRRAGASGG